MKEHFSRDTIIDPVIDTLKGSKTIYKGAMISFGEKGWEKKLCHVIETRIFTGDFKIQTFLLVRQVAKE